MRGSNLRTWMAALVLLAVVPLAGCPRTVTPPADNTNDNSTDNTNDNATDNTNDNATDNTNDNATDNTNDNTSDGAFVFNLTPIAIHSQGRIGVGDNIIAYTDIDPDRTPGVPNYFTPGDKEGRGIPDAANYDYDSFQVSGTKIILTGESDFAITIYDTATDTTDPIAETDIRLANKPIGNYVAGHFQADGDFVVTRNDGVDDGHIVKVIDMSTVPATILSLPNPGDVSSGFGVAQIAVDAETSRALAVASDVIYVYDLTDPTAEPTAFDFSAEGIGDAQVAFDNGIVLFADDSSDDLVSYLDVTDAANTAVAIDTPRRGADRLVLRGDNYGFLYSGPASQGDTAAIFVALQRMTLLTVG